MSVYEKINPSLYAESAYLKYTMEVVENRSIPSLKDGQKPVQRRILFAMKELGLLANKEPKKSARIIGDIIGKYHPHGDSAAYEAMVKMTQDFYLRYPLVKGQGNFGSIDGDSAAAMRYTEARLNPISELLLSELNMGSCDFIDNYDQQLKEPSVLPARLNFALMNGSFGLAVGLSTDMPSHNIRNVSDATIHCIKNPDASVEDIVEHLVAPDFPTGGQIIDSKETIIENYKTGNGSFTVRCRYKVEKLEKGQWQIVIYELPPSVSPSSLMETIGDIEKPKQGKDKNGKPKKLTQKQIEDKQLLLKYVSDYSDDTSGEEGTRVVLEPRSSRIDPEEMMNSLFKLLGLEKNSKINLVAIGVDNKAKPKNIKDMIFEWIEFRLETLYRRTQFELDKVKKRIHILEGRKIAFDHIDEIIELIKSSETPKEDLIERFYLTETQALDILEIKLRQLAKLELEAILKELESLYKEETRLESLLKSKTKMKNLMIKEIEFDTAKYEDKRRTLVKEEEKSTVVSTEQIVDEKVTVILTESGWVTSRKGHDIDIESVQLKDEDKVFRVMEGRTSLPVVLFADNGRAFNIRCKYIPNGKNMAHVNSLIDISDGVIVDAVFLNDNTKYLMANTDGYGFIVDSKNLLVKNRAGKDFFNIPKGAKMFPVNEIEDFKYITCASTDGRLLSYDIKEVKELPKGKGVQLIKLPKVKLADVKMHNEELINLLLSDNTYLEANIMSDDVFGKRALRGANLKQDIKQIVVN